MLYLGLAHVMYILNNFAQMKVPKMLFYLYYATMCFSSEMHFITMSSNLVENDNLLHLSRQILAFHVQTEGSFQQFLNNV